MSWSSISGPEASKPTRAGIAPGGAAPARTPVTSSDLFQIEWAYAWETFLATGQGEYFSVFRSGFDPGGLSSAWMTQRAGETEISELIGRAKRIEPTWTLVSAFPLGFPADPAMAFLHLTGRVAERMLFVSVGGSDPGHILSEIRKWTDLAAVDVAALVGVSRRSFYHWRTTGKIAAENREHLRAIADALRPLASAWQPARLKSWLRSNRSLPMRLLKTGKFEEFRRLAEQSLEQAAVPIRSARRIEVAEPEPPEYAVAPLSAAERRSLFDELLKPRAGVTHKPPVPRELTDSLPGEDE